MKKLGESLMNSDFDLAFQVFMRPEFFQPVGEVFSFTPMEFGAQFAKHFVWGSLVESLSFLLIFLPFFLPYCCILGNNMALWLNDELFYRNMQVWSSWIPTVFSFGIIQFPVFLHCTFTCTLSYICLLFSYPFPPDIAQDTAAHLWLTEMV